MTDKTSGEARPFRFGIVAPVLAEASTWRNSYLTAAAELRHGPPTKGVDRSRFVEVLEQTPIPRFL